MVTKGEYWVTALKATLHSQVTTTTSGLQHNVTHLKDPILLQMKFLHLDPCTQMCYKDKVVQQPLT